MSNIYREFTEQDINTIKELNRMHDELVVILETGEVTPSLANEIKNDIETQILDVLNKRYNLIPEGEDEEGQPYSSQYLDSQHDAALPMNPAAMCYLRFYWLTQKLSKTITKQFN